MNLDDAVYNAVHDYPGGVPALAVRLGMSKNVLQNKINPSQDHHKVTLAESMKIQQLTGDMRILHAMAEELGFICIPGGNFAGVSDQALLDLFNEEYAALGKFSGDFREAFADGEISRAECEQLRADVYRIKSVLAEIMARIESFAGECEDKRKVKKK